MSRRIWRASSGREDCRGKATCGVWKRIEEPTRYCIGFLGEEREEEDRERTGQRP